MSEAMPERELEEIEKRAGAATDGPWWLTENDSIKGWLGPAGDVPGWHSIGGMAIKEDSEFVICARQDIPNLVAEVRRSHAENAELRERVQVLEGELKAVEFAYFLAFDLLPRHLQEHVIKKLEERRNELRAALSPKQEEQA